MSEDEKNDFEPEMEKDGSVSDEEKDHSTSDAEQDKPSAGTATVPEDGLVIAASELPDLIPVIPIRPRPAFPNLFIPITITGKGRINALKRALNTPHRALGLILARNPEAEDSVDNFCRVGVGGTVVTFGAVQIRTVACALILGILTNLMLSKEKVEE